MIRADRLVAIGDGRRLAKKQRAVVPQPLEVPARVSSLNLHVLERVGVGDRERLVVRRDENHLAVVLPRPGGDVRRRQALELNGDLPQRLLGEGLRRRDEDSRRRGTVLCLAEQVGGNDHGVSGLVSNDQNLGRAGDKVDPHFPEQPPLRLDHIGVARACKKVHSVDRLGSERKRSERLHAAKDVDLVGTGKMHRGDRGVRHAPLEGRRACRDPLDARDLGRDDAHVGGCDHRIPAARDVGTDARQGDVPVTEPDARKRLHLEVDHRLPLGAGKRPHLLLAEPNVVQHLGRHPRHAGRDLVRGQAEGRRLPAVETGGEPPDGVVPVCRHGRNDLVDDLRDGVAVVRAVLRARPHLKRLQVASLPQV